MLLEIMDIKKSFGGLVALQDISFSVEGGETLGIIGQGSTGSDAAPVNPMTETPYFVLDSDGWGDGWSTGNAVRFNTEGALAPLWMARTVKPGQGTVENDSFELQIRGDAD